MNDNRPPFLWLEARMLRTHSTGYEASRRVVVSDRLIRGKRIVFNPDQSSPAADIHLTSTEFYNHILLIRNLVKQTVRAEDQALLHQLHQQATEPA